VKYVEQSRATANVRALRPAGDDAETAALLTRLLKDAIEGKLVGALVIPLYSRNGTTKPFDLQLAGMPATNPTLAAGAMSACQVLVQEVALERAGLL
jgi:hypothetical protein